MQAQPYLFFEGRCDEAIAFYKTAIGAELISLMRYKEGPEPEKCPTGSADKVMHMSFRIGETVVLASDGNCSGKQNFQGFALAIQAKTDAEAEKLFAALSNGGNVQMPIAETFFATRFGMVTDRFGVMWMVLKQKAMKQ